MALNRLRQADGEFRKDEKILLTLALGLALFCAGVNYQRARNARPLPALFEGKSRATPGLTSGAGFVRVHVAGAVRHPGVRTLPANARVQDAMQAAGGLAQDNAVGQLNLAARLRDGQQITVPTRAQAARLQPLSEQHDVPARRIAPVVVEINVASSEELERLPGIGPALAARIVERRKAKGSFRSLQDLDQVKGLGPKKLEKLRESVRF